MVIIFIAEAPENLLLSRILLFFLTLFSEFSHFPDSLAASNIQPTLQLVSGSRLEIIPFPVNLLPISHRIAVGMTPKYLIPGRL